MPFHIPASDHLAHPMTRRLIIGRPSDHPATALLTDVALRNMRWGGPA